ncbi:MAG TPA: serine/threonine-protein kinase, partial [Bryobacteraceae bacterium]|nr:serine/threonine-protein kinase [Bryobacteraceae bacterium]
MPQVGRYEVVAEAGRGAMGVVYRALDPSIGRTVAIKTLRLPDDLDENERLRLTEPLVREATSAGRLSHPNIVTIYDISQEGDLAYIAMEFVDGPSLEQKMREGPLENADILKFLRQTAEALDYAHGMGVVHRDIKPSNILLHQGVVVKVTDFGVAKIQSHHATLSGNLIGTPNYMAPEQVQGEPVNGKADQFALAVIAYELLTGQKPFAADSIPALAFKIVHEDPPPPKRFNPTLDWTVEKVLGRALAKSPGNRYDTCSAFVKALENSLKVSKGWASVSAAEAATMPTVREPRAQETLKPAPATVVPEPAVAPPPEDVEPEPIEERTPAWLRVMRVMAVV